MKALRVHEFGGPEKFQWDEVPMPEPGPGQVRAKVAGFGVNQVDWKIREGHMQAIFPVELPYIVGSEFSGTVDKLGEGVTEFQVGDPVYGMATQSCAEYLCADAATLAAPPATMDLADAAAVPVAGLTAWQALFDNGGLETGQKVLIHAGSGGVGSFAIQLAKWKGATVASTASAKNLHLLQELGADVPIDYTAGPAESVISDCDVVVETIGGDNIPHSLACLKPGGVLVNLTGPPPTELAEAQGKRGLAMSAKPNAEQLRLLANLITDLKVNVIIDTVVPMHEAVELEKESQAGHAVGKMVVRISE